MTPSIVCIQRTMKERAILVNKLNCKRIHLDLTIGRSMPNLISLDSFLKEKRSIFKPQIDYHIFNYQENWSKIHLPEFTGDRVIIHIFPWMKKNNIISMISYFSNKFSVGIAQDLHSHYNDINHYINMVDCILVMGIEAGEQGKPLDQKALKNLKRLRKYHKIILGIDGGVNYQTFNKLIQLTDFVVIGSLLFNFTDINHQWNQLKKQIKKI